MTRGVTACAGLMGFCAAIAMTDNHIFAGLFDLAILALAVLVNA